MGTISHEASEYAISESAALSPEKHGVLAFETGEDSGTVVATKYRPKDTKAFDNPVYGITTPFTTVEEYEPLGPLERPMMPEKDKNEPMASIEKPKIAAYEPMGPFEIKPDNAATPHGVTRPDQFESEKPLKVENPYTLDPTAFTKDKEDDDDLA